MPNKRSTVLLAGLTAAVLTLAACGGDSGGQQQQPPAAQPQTPAPASTPSASAPTDVQLPEGVTPEMVQEGQQIFVGQGLCATCHGMDAKGTTLAPNLTDQEWLNIDGSYDQIVNLVKTGVPNPKQYPSPMMPMGGAQLTEDQVRAVAAYVYAISHGN